MTWIDKANETAERYGWEKYRFEYWELNRRNIALLDKGWHTLALEDQVGETTPLPLVHTLKDLNDMMCAGCFFDSLAILYSGKWQKVNGIWCIPVEAIIHSPLDILKRVYDMKH